MLEAGSWKLEAGGLEGPTALAATTVYAGVPDRGQTMRPLIENQCILGSFQLLFRN